MAESGVHTVSGTEFLRNYGTLMNEARANRRTVIVTSHGRPQVAIVAIEEYEKLVRLAAWAEMARQGGE